VIVDEIWAKVLKCLRESGDNSLFTLVADINDVEFTADGIVINADDDAEFNVLNKNIKLLNGFAGGDYIVISKKDTDKINDNLVEILQEMFEDKLCLV
jgi:hypothetical protein